MRVWPACVYVHHVQPGTHRGQNRELETPELDLKVVVSNHVTAGKSRSYASAGSSFTH